MPATKKRTKKKAAAAPAASRGLDARRLASASPPAGVESLGKAIEADGGSVLATYRDPLGSNWQILAALPIDKVEPTPYQRDLSETHVARVAKAIDQLDRYLDPVIAVPGTERHVLVAERLSQAWRDAISSARSRSSPSWFRSPRSRTGF